MSDQGAFEISQGLTVLPPRSSQAYPIPCGEWQALKLKIGKTTIEPWVFQALGSLLVGAALSALLAILFGTFSAPSQDREKLIAWAVFWVTGISGALCLFFADQQRRLHRERSSDIVAQMELIESRFDQLKV